MLGVWLLIAAALFLAFKLVEKGMDQRAAEKAINSSPPINFPNSLAGRPDAPSAPAIRAWNPPSPSIDPEAARIQAERASQERFDKAWRAYFIPSPSCERTPGTVDCANQYIRAKREFEARYAARGR